MCGIIGFSTTHKTTEQLELLHALMKESSIRGLHAFGVSFYNFYNDIVTEKWMELPSAIDFAGNTLIFHNRYSTSGDWHDVNNNQPIHTISYDGKGDMSFALNGVLSMKLKEEYEEEYGIQCESENDAEIFNKLVAKGLSPVRALRKLGKASFAGVYLKDGNLCALRNRKRPLYWFTKHGATYIVSTQDIAKRALSDRTRIRAIRSYREFIV